MTHGAAVTVNPRPVPLASCDMEFVARDCRPKFLFLSRHSATELLHSTAHDFGLACLSNLRRAWV